MFSLALTHIPHMCTHSPLTCALTHPSHMHSLTPHTCTHSPLHVHSLTPHTCTHSPLTRALTHPSHTYAPPVPAIPPPSSVKLEFINISAVLVSWSYPFEDVPPPIQFLLQCSKDGRPYQNVTKLMNDTQFVFGHMLLSAYYQFRVRAYRRGVASEPSQPSYSFLNGITGEAVHGDFYRETVKRVGSCQLRFL